MYQDPEGFRAQVLKAKREIGAKVGAGGPAFSTSSPAGAAHPQHLHGAAYDPRVLEVLTRIESAINEGLVAVKRLESHRSS